MIAVLISDAVERVVRLRQVFWLQGLLEKGFSGFASWSDEALRRELTERGFDLVVGLPDDVAHAGENDYWENDVLSMLAEHMGSVGETEDRYGRFTN